MSTIHSKRIVIFAPYPKGTAPSQRFRFEQYLELFEKEGYVIEYKAFLSDSAWNILYKDGSYIKKTFHILASFFRRWKEVFTTKRYDIIFIHREMAHIGPPIFEWILAKILKRKFIYDLDDAIWMANYSESNAKFQRLKAYWKVNYCMKWASKISAGNEFLANYSRQFNPNVTVIPTTIDLMNQHNLITDYDKTPIIIGWTGTLTTMNYLEEIIPVLQKLEDNYSFIFRVISNQEPKFDLKSLQYIPWNKSTEIADLAQIQIGLMPLADDKWAQGKCGFKALQYMALGIPTLLSPVGVNKQIVKHQETGFFCSTTEEWMVFLEKLLQDSSLRKTIGQAGRAVIQNHYSVTANFNKYLNLLQ
ncbi:MAG: glycosyltransferase [Brumimicrobium sp.]|nr:glycosyltransferase [Brumimicrobium sp.]MCO5269542.1 glycosyltransferase [Brumimicrobium sp.]